jgi:hypothetical protein
MDGQWLIDVNGLMFNGEEWLIMVDYSDFIDPTNS